MTKIDKFRTPGGIQQTFLFPPEKTPYQHIHFLKNTGLYPQADDYDPKFHDLSFIKNELNRHFYSIIPPHQSIRINLSNITSIHAHGPYCFNPIFNFLHICGIEDDVIKILTPHNPAQPTCEELESAKIYLPKHKLDDFRAIHNYRDEIAFERADALIFPCKESLEGYYETWPKFKDLIRNKPLYFTPTGVTKKSPSIPNESLKKSLNIPNHAKIILYIGRFMDVRGFNMFVDSAKLILSNKKNNVYFIAVGKQDNSRKLIDDPRWIEHKFTHNPIDFISMADACVAVGKYHFFDISMLETLSTGTIYIAPYSSGSKYIHNKTTGVLYFDPGSLDSFASTILKFLKITNKEILTMKQDNIKLYNEEFTESLFAERYLDLYDKIYNYFGVNKSPNRRIAKIPYFDGITQVLMK